MIKRLLLLNGLGVLGAVVNHSTGWGFTALFWWTDRYLPGPVPNFSQLDSLSYFGLRIAQQSIMFAIPAFLFVSGFFVAFAAGRSRDRVTFQTVGVRVKNLVIPYVVWSMLIFGGRVLEGSTDTPMGYLGQLLFGRAAPPYYYVPLVTQFFLLSPLLVLALSRFWKTTLAAAGLLQLLVHLARYSVMLKLDWPLSEWIIEWAPGWFIPETLFWFVLGITAGLQRARFKQWLARFKWIFPALAVVLGIVGVVEWEWIYRSSGSQWLPLETTLVDSLYAGSCILSVVAFEKWSFPFESALSSLGTRSFGIYLIHAPVLEVVSRTFYHSAPWLLPHQAIFQTLLVLFGLGVPLAFMLVVQRSPIRSYYQYIFG